MVRSTHRTAGVVVLCAGAAASHANLIEARWLNPVNGIWTDAAKWSSQPNFPNNGSPTGVQYVAIIDATGGPYTVTTPFLTPHTIQGLKLSSADATLRVMGGLQLQSDSHIAAGVLRLNIGGTIRGAGNLLVDGLMRWEGGEMSGSGVTTVSKSGTLLMSDWFERTLNRSLVIEGVAQWEEGELIMLSGSELINRGDFTLNGTEHSVRAVANQPVAFVNEGMMRTLGFAQLGANIDFVNHGLIEVQSSRFTVLERFVNAGAVDVWEGATLRLGAALQSAEGSMIQGAGNVAIVGGVHDIQPGAFSNSGRLIVENGDVTLRAAHAGGLELGGGIVRFKYLVEFGGSLVTSSTLYFDAGFNIDPGAELRIGGMAIVDLGTQARQFSTGDIDGTLTTGDALFSGGLTWRGGQLVGGGVTTVAEGGNLILTGGEKTLSRTLSHHGDTSWTGGDLILDSVSYTNSGDMLVSAVVSLRSPSGADTFTNTGAIDVTGDLGVMTAFSNDGQVSVHEGATLRLGGDLFTGDGSMIEGVGLVDFAGGRHDLSAERFGDGLSFLVSGGEVEAAPSFAASSWEITGGSALFLGDVTMTDTVLSGGALGSTGRLDPTGLEWSGGALVGGGESRIAKGGTFLLAGNAPKTLSRELVNLGTLTINTGSLFVNDGSIHNHGDLVLGPGAGIRSAAGGGSLINSGLITSSGPGIVAIEGSGLQLVNSGTMHFGSGVTFRLGANVAPGDLGSLTVDGNLHFTNGSIAMSASGWSVSGGISMLGGDVVFAGSPSPSSWTFTSGSATFQQEFNAGALLRTNGTALRFEQGVAFDPNATAHVQGGGALDFAANDVAIGRLLLLGGAIDGEGEVNIAQQLTWNSGAMRGSGRTVVEAGAFGSLGVFSPITLSRTLENFGTINLIAGLLLVDGGELRNHGTLRLLSGSGAQGIGAGGSIINEGVMRIDSSGPFTLRDNGAALEFRNLGQFEVLEGSSVTLAGAPTLENEGQYLIDRWSQIEVEGDFTNTSTAELAFSLGGAKDRGLSGLMTITGDAALSGALVVTTPETFVGAWGERWTVMTFASLTSDFDTFDLPETTDEMLRWYAQTDGETYDVGVSHIADIDHDGLIGLADLNVIAGNFNAFGSWSDGDVDGDGFVGFADLNTVLSLFNTSAPRNVPGPGGALAIGLLAIARGRPKRSARG